ncbi:hypothetical protein B1748_18430 [Paenibacillus sp. MY03]|nr:hypothetical protein B1748_18430 [Paenibacillus sp. MY03]
MFPEETYLESICLVPVEFKIRRRINFLGYFVIKNGLFELPYIEENRAMLDIKVKQDLREMAKRLQELRGSL